MGSISKILGGITVAVLIMTGSAVVAPAAQARQTVRVPCSATALIAAVANANSAGAGTLLLASNCDYALTTPSGTGRGPDGLLITGNLDLVGGVSTRISRSAVAVSFRVIEVAAGAVLRMRNIFVSGGLTDNANPMNDTGGGILNSRGNVVLTNTMVTGNTADNGAGISNDSGRLILDRTVISGNTTRASGGGGGGMYNDGTLVAAVSIVRDNRANTNGGGIYNGQGGHSRFTNVTFSRNTAGANGGGLFNATDGRLILLRTLVTRNTATTGGGIFNAGTAGRVALVTSLINRNTPNNCAGTVTGCTG